MIPFHLSSIIAGVPVLNFMVATLTFNLPEEDEQFRVAQDGWKWKSALSDMDEFLRTKLKHGNPYRSVDEALSAARQHLHDNLNGHSIDIF